MSKGVVIVAARRTAMGGFQGQFASLSASDLGAAAIAAGSAATDADVDWAESVLSAVGAVFFGRLTASGGDWADAISHGLLITVGLVALALVLGVTDLVAARRARGRGTPVTATGGR